MSRARYSAHVSMLFTELPALARPAAAAAAGFTLIETWWPPAQDVEAWARAVGTAGVGVSCLNADGGDIAAGQRGFCNLAERDADTVAAVRTALDLAVRLHAPCVNVLPGLIADDRPREDQLAHAVEVYRVLGALAAAEGRTIVVEPINALDVPRYLLPTARAVASFLERVDHPGVRMLFDAYHCARSGDEPLPTVRAVAAWIGHVQYADHPGRGAPGTGAIDLDAFRATLEEVGYTGPIGMEFAPAGPTRDALGFMG